MRLGHHPLASGALLVGTAMIALSAQAHENDPAGESAIGDAIEAAMTGERSHARYFRDVQPTFRAAARAAGAAPVADAARLGAWSPVDDWPVLPVHAALLPNGKVLAWDATPDDFGDDVHTTDRYETRVTVWDPDTNGHLRTNNDTDTDLFCAGSALLWDGRVLFAGGDGGRQGKNGPLSNSNLYDPYTNTWTRTDDMTAPRWYSSVAALGTGEMLTFGGAYTPTPIAEVFGFNKRWRGLPIKTQYTFSGDYSWLQATSDGDVMYFGPHDTLSRLDTTGKGTWSAGAPRDREGYRGYGSYAPYDTDRVLVAGGGDSLASAVVVDTRSATATPTSPMANGRRQHNLTVLADGSVLATGGNRTGANTLDIDGGVFEAEQWNPKTGRWTTLAPATIDRQYHSIALLLADGRVLTGGGGYCPLCSEVGYHEQNVEIFSPPYLFAPDGSPAVRPRITTVPSIANYDEGFVVATPDAARIRDAHLVRLGSVTHSQNHEQRLVPLEHVSFGDGLLINAPADRDLAPPGHYLLFLVDVAGTPSIGQILQIGQPIVRPDEVVKNTLQANRPDYYAIEGKGAHRLSVNLRGADSNVALFVGAGRLPSGASGDRAGFSNCLVADGDANTRRCDVSALGDTTWYLGVSGGAGVDYTFVAHLGADETSPTPTADTTAPAADTRVDALTARDVTERAVTLTWQAPPGMANVNGYEIWRDGVLIDYRETRRHVEPSLFPGTSYRFHVVAVGTDLARGQASRTLVVTTAVDERDYADRYSPYIPSRPTGLRYVRYSTSSAELFWEGSFDNGVVTSYEIWRDGERLGTSGGLSYFDNALQPDTDHSWYVVAVDDEGNRSAPSAATGTAMPDPVDEPDEDELEPFDGPDRPVSVTPPTVYPPDTPTGPDGEPTEKEVATANDSARPGSSSGGGGLGIALLLGVGAISIGRRRTSRTLLAGTLALAVGACSSGGDSSASDSGGNAPTSPDEVVAEKPTQQTPTPDGATDGSGEPAENPDGASSGGADPDGTPPDTPDEPDGTAQPGEDQTFPADSPEYVGRPWQSAATLAQDAVDALGLHAIRARAEQAAQALGLHADASVDVACPGGGSASATTETDERRDERRHAFSACTLADGSTIDGLYDVVRRDDSVEGGSVKREIEERFALGVVSGTERLVVEGTFTEALTASRADECGLVASETVLRIDVPTMRVDAVEVLGLAIEDITTTRLESAVDGAACGRATTELAFSDSARVTDETEDSAYAIRVNRTGSVLRDGDGVLSSSGRDLRIRIYHPDDDASLDLSPVFGDGSPDAAQDGVAVTIDNHPGRIEFEDRWNFLP